VAAPRVPVVVAKYTPRAKAGGVGRSVAYYSWRPGADRPREHPRVWHAHGGRELDYAAARAEIAAAARDAPYTYRLVLSPNAEQGLEPGDYAAVLGRHFDRWYLVAHHAGDHPHAHAVAPAARCLGVRELADLRAALGERSRHREAERGRESLTSGREARVREPSREPAQERDLW
jgi:hypothetical protein